MKKLFNRIMESIKNPSSPQRPVLTYEGVAIKFIKTVGIENELFLDTPIKFDNNCWVWKVAVDPKGMFWLSDATLEWFELEMTDKEVPHVLGQLYPVLMDMQLNQLITA